MSHFKLFCLYNIKNESNIVYLLRVLNKTLIISEASPTTKFNTVNRYTIQPYKDPGQG